mmetsp:Transcript_86071/g.171903  ORF Transcript_86071/g.171903 Transcript_86071/m.171903 type:complete len:130 (-) Transcript_86071:218-607(-)
MVHLQLGLKQRPRMRARARSCRPQLEFAPQKVLRICRGHLFAFGANTSVDPNNRARRQGHTRSLARRPPLLIESRSVLLDRETYPGVDDSQQQGGAEAPLQMIRHRDGTHGLRMQFLPSAERVLEAEGS